MKARMNTVFFCVHPCPCPCLSVSCSCRCRIRVHPRASAARMALHVRIDRAMTTSWIRTLALLALTACASRHAAPGVESDDLARLRRQARNVEIVRDDWGIAHVRGQTDADAVFGMVYAQAEDDFNRVETNYINAMGRLAEAEGEAEVWRDLRMKLFIDPDSLR